MKLNADIIFSKLKQKYPVEMYGPSNSKMCYSCPELYIDNSMHFYSGHLYLATVEHLPPRPTIEHNVILVCIGENARLRYYQDHATVLLIRKKQDFFSVYASLQSIFNSYNEWESKLLNMLLSTTSIQDILPFSEQLFGAPIYALNAAFQFIGASREPDISTILDPGENLSPEAIGDFMKQQELSMDKHGALLLKMNAGTFLCTNLFNKNGDFDGCFFIDFSKVPFVKGYDKLAEHLGQIIEKVLEMNPVMASDDHRFLKEILETTIKELPLSGNQKLFLKSSNRKKNYVCISLHYKQQLSALPINYICSVFESMFNDSMFFEHNNALLGLIPSEVLPQNALTGSVSFTKHLTDMRLCAGISNEFSDLYMLRVYYQQAEAAIENGMMCYPSGQLFHFSDYVLMEMISNALGNLPAEAYFPKGFAKLIEHDRENDVSYLDTLSVFLDENMSYAKAARLLYIHRSSLVERIERIEKDLGLDLSDPDERLQLQILLKAISLEQVIRDRKF